VQLIFGSLRASKGSRTREEPFDAGGGGEEVSLGNGKFVKIRRLVFRVAKKKGHQKHWATNFGLVFFIFIFWCFLMFFGALSPKMTLVFS